MLTLSRDSAPSPLNPLAIMGITAVAIAFAVAIVATGELAALALVGLIVSVFILRWPIFGLYLTTALLLLSGPAGLIGSVRVAVPVTAAKICGLVTFIAWIVDLLVRRKRLQLGWESMPLIAFFAWCAVGVFHSSTWEAQWPEWVRLGTLVAFFVLCVNMLNTEDRVHNFTMLIVYCGVAMSAFAVLQYFVPAMHLQTETAIADIGAGAGGAYVDPESLTGGAAVRVSGPAGHSNWLALIILLIMPLNVYWFTTAKSRKAKAACLASVLVELAALVLTFTRTGFLVGVIILLVLGARRLVRINPYRLSALALALVLAWLMIPSAYKERVLTPSMYTQSDSVRHRLQLQQAAWEMIQEKPIWGVGLGGYGINIVRKGSEVALIMRWLVNEQNWDPVNIGTHNMYLQLGSETGLIGLGLMLLFFFLLLRDLRRAELAFKNSGQRRAEVLVMSLEVSVMSFLLCAVFLHALQQKIWWMMVAIAAVVPLYRASRPATHEEIESTEEQTTQ